MRVRHRAGHAPCAGRRHARRGWTLPRLLAVPVALVVLATLGLTACAGGPSLFAAGREAAGGQECVLATDIVGTSPPVNSPCTRPSDALVRDGRPIVVDLAPLRLQIGTETRALWQRPASTDPSWQLTFYGLTWLPPLMRSAIRDGQSRSQSALLDTVARFYEQNPDPDSNALGWDEGTSLRRLESLICMYSMVADDRVAQGMRREASVLLGWRYYGPPRHAVHNHGVMANVRLIQAADLIGEPGWADTARGRIAAEVHQAFSPLGTTYEQSSGYQLVNVQMWARAARMLAARDPLDPTVDEIRAAIQQAALVGAWVTDPDGDIAQIGDAGRQGGRTVECTGEPGAFRDDETGWAVGRWSWTDPSTSHYTLRYGPPRQAHGHPDQGALTWSTAGRRVLVGSGYFGYETGNPFVAYGRSPDSANLARPMGGTAGGGGLYVDRATTQGSRHEWTLRGVPFGRNQVRDVTVDDPGRRLTVRDELPDGGSLQQRWLLDPTWRVVSTGAGVATFAGTGGARLEVRTSAGALQLFRGTSAPVQGWVFPDTGVKQAAVQLVLVGGAAVETTFTLT